MSNAVENLLIIGPVGKKEYKEKVQAMVREVLSESNIDGIDSTNVYEVLNSLGYGQQDLSNPTVVEEVATRIAHAIIRLIKDKKAHKAKQENDNENSYHKFCAAVDSSCVVGLAVQAKLKASEEVPGLTFIDLPARSTAV